MCSFMSVKRKAGPETDPGLWLQFWKTTPAKAKPTDVNPEDRVEIRQLL
jgi:hypothetical protein